MIERIGLEDRLPGASGSPILAALRTVAWYPDGTDGWQDAGLPLSEAVPAPQPGQ
jgi:hypothetical protein